MLKLKYLLWSCLLFLSVYSLQAQKISEYKTTPYEKELTALDTLRYNTKAYQNKLNELRQKVQADNKYPAQAALLLQLDLLEIGIKDAYQAEESLNIINALEALTKKQTGVYKNILYAILAQEYADYLQRNMWILRNRTNVSASVQLSDKATWDIQRWADGIMRYHELSLQGEEIKNAPSKLYFPLLTKEFDNEADFEYEIQANLYDVLVHKTLNFYKSEYNYLTQPAERFYIEDEKALAALNDFLAWTPQTTDIYSNQFKAIKLYQSWLKFNLEKGNKVALVYADYERLSYVYSKHISANKNALFEKALADLRAQYKNTTAGLYLDYEYAKYLLDKESAPETKNNNKKAAAALVNDLLANAKLPKFMKAPTESLKDIIYHKDYSFQIESAHSILQAALVQVEYKNIERLYYRIIPRTSELEAAIEKASAYDIDINYEQREINIFNAILSGKAVRDSYWDLPKMDDFSAHTTETYFKGLPTGKYYLMLSYQADFKPEKTNALKYKTFNVSNLHYLVHKNRNNVYHDFYVLDRITGMPIKGANVDIFMGQNYKEKAANLTTEEDGLVTLSKLKKDLNGDTYTLRISKDGDTIQTPIYYLNNYYYSNVVDDISDDFIISDYHLFLDRAIYRPGQTVYFKGIALQRLNKGKAHKVLANEKIELQLYDANGRSLKAFVFHTNEFGAFSGTVALPTDGRTGQMTFSVNGQYIVSFNVEEYKRPQFRVQMLPVKEAYKLEEQVKVQGEALAYAGNTLSNAKVQYRVVREVRFPYWSWRWGYNPFSTVEQEIANGETTTDEKGVFSIDFTAIADKSIPLKNKPQFIYTVYVDVTDITGETHSEVATVVVGSIAQNISLEIPNSIDKHAPRKLAILSKNLNNEYEPSEGTIKIVALKAPTQIYSKRQWEKPEVKAISAEEFKAYFPHFAYDKEDERSAWQEESTVWQSAYNTEKDKQVDLSSFLSNNKAGVYRIYLTTKDKYGEEIVVEKEIEIFDSKSTALRTYDPLYTYENLYNVQPDTTLNLSMGAISNAYVLVIVDIDGVEVFKNWVKISQLHTIPFLVKEEYRDRVKMHFYTFLHNRFYEQAITINIPYTNKDLKIELLTFRDKLLPGQKEEWKIKISGPKGEKVMAELLAGMYDASLDAFASNNWTLPKPRKNAAASQVVSPSLEQISNDFLGENFTHQYYDNSGILNFIDLKGVAQGVVYEVLMMRGSAAVGSYTMSSQYNMGLMEYDSEKDEEEIENADADTGSNKEGQIRTNLKETVFFYPQVQTDAEGNFILSFTMNEALTQWKLMLLAHTKNLEWKYEERTVVTQKDLMVQPNALRFFRQGDTIEFPAKISNLTSQALTGDITLMLFDAATMQPIDAILANNKPTQNFSIAAENNTVAFWKLIVPEDFTAAVTYRVIAKAGAMSDGEENALPVVTNRMLITETMPLPIRGGQSKSFDFKRMNEVSKNSTTFQHHAFTLEFTQNPAWYAVQALPYLMEYPYECSEQIFSRYYANALASSVANSTPKIKQVFEQWKNVDTNALKSNLHKNQELKYALLEETPWVLAAENEALQKRNIALLFDLNRMSNELALAKEKLLQRQLSNGGFPWFFGGKDDWYITQYIVQGMAHLKNMNALPQEDEALNDALQQAVYYIDNQVLEYYKKYIYPLKNKQRDNNNLSPIIVHYLYTRSFYLKDLPILHQSQKEVAYFVKQAKTYWKTQSNYNKALIALHAHRTGNKKLAKDIVQSLKNSAINSAEMGMYWNSNASYFWYEMPIETHTLMIELFDEVANDQVAVEDLKTWLLKNKQTTHWKTTKATANAVYALLSHGVNLIEENKPIDIKIGGKNLDMSTIKQEAGTGYFKTTWTKDKFDNAFANIEVKNNNQVVAWGAAYWQYFEDLDKVTSFEETPLKINKEVFVQKNTATGPVLTPMKEGSKVNVGDLIKVRVEIRVDRAMEYVHLKDMRAAGLEPINTISGYKYQGGLGYYENTRDMASNFFIDYLPKGTYVFEYELRATYKGNYSNGITTMQCMYAPEFTSHSKGIRLTIE